jgi:hypothetical protein
MQQEKQRPLLLGYRVAPPAEEEKEEKSNATDEQTQMAVKRMKKNRRVPIHFWKTMDMSEQLVVRRPPYVSNAAVAFTPGVRYCTSTNSG